jgi:hypothetical protein
MARETKAQRDARLEAELQARLSVAKATYTERMMAVLARATKENFELEVKDMLFKVEDRDERRVSPYVVQPAWSETADMDLYSLELSVELKEEARAKREHVSKLRASALAKLTAEERELLGL